VWRWQRPSADGRTDRAAAPQGPTSVCG
jgi:hypothetical protein